MGDRAYVEIVCREEDEPLFEALGFMQEFRHALPANVVTMVDAEASEEHHVAQRGELGSV